MYKRIIAITAALSMVFGSALIPAADTGGEPVRQVTCKSNKTVKTELRNLKTEISTTELTYGPIRPVEAEPKLATNLQPVATLQPIKPIPVKEKTNDTRRDNGDMYEPVERILGGNETDNNRDSSGGEPAVQPPDPAGNPEPYGDVLEGTAGADPEPEQAPEEEFRAYGDDYEETGEDGGEDVEPEPEPESEWSYYGNCRITFYCPAECCCGQWAYGATASGEMPAAGWTVANGNLPFGTHVLIDGQEYCVTDRGVGGDQFDIFVDTHDEALARGLYYTDVYVRW